MARRFLKENIAWIIPTTAIVLAAAGLFDDLRLPEGFLRDNTSMTATAQTAPVQVPALPSPQALLPDIGQPLGEVTADPLGVDVARTAPLDLPAPGANAVNSSVQAALLASGHAVLAQIPTPPPVLAQPEPQEPEPVPVVAPADPEPVPAPPRARPAPIENPSDFFREAQEKLANEDACIDDLRVMAAQVKIYFPAGGVTADENGINQAKIMAKIAGECPGVRLEVQGHSDPSGDPGANLRLSEKRANAVIQRIGASGTDTSLFIGKGMGDTVPSQVSGPNSGAYYDRRVEFVVIDTRTDRTVPTPSSEQRERETCVAELAQAVQITKLFYAPRSVTVAPSDIAAAMEVATIAKDCPGARLRLVGQHMDSPGSGESPKTGRLRAVVLMSALVNAGIPSEQIIIAAPSRSSPLAGKPDQRVDFDIVLEEG